MRAKNLYSLPIPIQYLERIDKLSSPYHVGKLRNAIDLIAPKGTPVLAAADGVVTFVKDDSHTGGPSIENWNDSNFVVISHASEEFSRYDHLQHMSAEVRQDQQVSRGQLIARVGMTGITFLPHLHFQVFVFIGPNIWTDFDTLPLPDFV